MYINLAVGMYLYLKKWEVECTWLCVMYMYLAGGMYKYLEEREAGCTWKVAYTCT